MLANVVVSKSLLLLVWAAPAGKTRLSSAELGARRMLLSTSIQLALFCQLASAPAPVQRWVAGARRPSSNSGCGRNGGWRRRAVGRGRGDLSPDNRYSQLRIMGELLSQGS